MTVPLSPALQSALACLRIGDMSGAQAQAEAALSASPGDPAACAFLGMLFCQQGQPVAAIPYLSIAVTAWPHDAASRFNLVTALIATGNLDEADRLCATLASGDVKLQRLAGYIHQTRGRLADAESAYALVVAKLPQDFESWNNLGNVRAELGKVDAAIQAFERAIALRPDVPVLYLNFSEQMARADRVPERTSLMRAAVAAIPDHAKLYVDLGLAETVSQNFEDAKRAFREALRLHPGLTAAYIELALLLEQLNEVDALESLARELEEQGVTEPELAFVKAWSLRRRGEWEQALAMAEQVPETIERPRRAQLIAELSERLGDTDRAFEAFQEMNAASEAQGKFDSNDDYREEVTQQNRLMARAWVASWTAPAVPTEPPPPVFIVGFPRSGTTLLDTLLMNMPRFHILEELPVLRQPMIELGDVTRLAKLNSARVARLRASYFDALATIAPPSRSDQTIVDKYPLHMARIPLIHRIFPDAKIVFAERHPCDVVLSCFMANFTLNRGMRHFTTIKGAAKLYDTVFEAWTLAKELLPIDYHVVRYERMIEDLEGEMRGLLTFLNVPWDASVLDNQGAAARRTHISTASYSQVTEPIYRRASGRWERYRQHLAPVFPTLAPWVERMGYSL